MFFVNWAKVFELLDDGHSSFSFESYAPFPLELKQHVAFCSRVKIIVNFFLTFIRHAVIIPNKAEYRRQS